MPGVCNALYIKYFACRLLFSYILTRVRFCTVRFCLVYPLLGQLESTSGEHLQDEWTNPSIPRSLCWWLLIDPLQSIWSAYNMIYQRVGIWGCPKKKKPFNWHCKPGRIAKWPGPVLYMAWANFLFCLHLFPLSNKEQAFFLFGGHIWHCRYYFLQYSISLCSIFFVKLWMMKREVLWAPTGSAMGYHAIGTRSPSAPSTAGDWYPGQLVVFCAPSFTLLPKRSATKMWNELLAIIVVIS